jgi:glutathione S-transferase
MSASAPNRLVTIPISHYCEKARWALDRAGVPYEEHAHLQVLHRIATRRAGGGLTAPVFVSGGYVLSESAEILAWADARTRAELALYPTDPDRAAEVRRLEADFDARLGPHGRLWMYEQLRDRRDLAIAYGTTGVPAWERALLPVLYPAVFAVVARVLGVSPANAAESEREVRAVFEEVAVRLADGRPYLCGERFTAADLTFSALAAPVLMPPGYGVPLPEPPELPPHAAAVVRELRAHPAGAHALEMFATERRRPERRTRET